MGFAAAQEAGPDFTPGVVFGMSNDVDGNEVVACNHGADGRLEPDGTFGSGGTGSGTVEDSANGLIIANRSGESSPNNSQGPPGACTPRAWGAIRSPYFA